MKVWLINLYGSLPGEAWRPTRPALMAEGLAELGHSVTWFTADIDHVTKTRRAVRAQQVSPLFSIVVLRGVRYRHNVSALRLVNEIVFAIRLLIRLCTGPGPDVIIVGHATQFVGLAAVIISRLRRAPLIIDVIDLWPEAYSLVLARLPKLLVDAILKPFYLLRRFIFSRADGLVAQSIRNMTVGQADAPQLPPERKVVAYEGIDVGAPPSPRYPGMAQYLSVHTGLRVKHPNEVWVLYAGTLGEQYDVDTLLRAAKTLQECCPQVRVLLAGTGPRYRRLQRYIAENRLSNTEMLGQLSPPQLAFYYSRADIGLCTYCEGSRVAMPCKIYDYFAAGLAVISSLPGELQELLEASGAGQMYTPGDDSSLVKVITRLTLSVEVLSGMKAKSAALAKTFDKAVQYARVGALCEGVLSWKMNAQGLRRAILISPFDIVPGDVARIGRFAGFAQTLRSKGYDVVWIASRYDHKSKVQRPHAALTTEDGTRVMFVNGPSYQGNISMAREVHHLLFALRASSRLWKELRHERSIVICSLPPLLTPALTAIVTRTLRAPFILDIHDAWPEAFAMIFGGSILMKVVGISGGLLRMIATKLSHGVTAVSSDYLDLLPGLGSGRATNVTQLGHPFYRLWETRDNDWAKYSKNPGDIWAVYVGTVSGNYDLSTAIKGCALVPHLRLFIVGDGSARNSLEEQAARDYCEVIFTGSLPYYDMANLLIRADIGLVSADSRSAIRLPKKTFDYLAAGLPIITSIAGGELERLLVTNNIGSVYEEGNCDSFSAALELCLSLDRQLVRLGACQLARERFDETVLSDNFVAWLEGEVLSKGEVVRVGAPPKQTIPV